MQMTSLEILLDKYKQGILTGAEKQQLSEMILSPEHQQELEILIDNGFADPNLNELGDPETRELIYQQLRLQTETTAIQPVLSRSGEPASPSVIRKWWIGAAAAVFILFGTAVYLLFLNKSQKQIAVIPTQQERYKNDAPPGSNKAILTLGNGSTITLDSAQNGFIAQQGNSKVMKLAGGQLAYAPAGAGNQEAGSANHEAGAGNHEVLYNMVSTPRGGQYKLSLPDGSVIWLNAASSIRYPTVFSGKERKVEIRGEAYFEVAKNAAKPFKVKILTASGSGGEVEVLGTHFNINAYDDEAVIRTTLLQGSVRVTMGSASTLLVPGEQVQVDFSRQLKLIKEADVDEAVAWMKGVFKFKQVTIGPLMRAIARWYDIDVTYEGKITNHFIVTIPRNITITNVFRILEQTGEVHFRIEGKKVTVMP
jgi:transmembrane sensor